MKKSFMTRVLAMGLSLAMAFSLSAATNVTTAEAATSPMESTKITITEGKTSSWVYLKNRGNSKYRIKSYKRTETAKKFITAKVGTKKRAVKVTAKKDVVTNAGLQQKQVAMTINLVKKADANKKNAKVVKTAKLYVVVKAKPVEVKKATITDVAQNTSTKLTMTLAAAIEKIDIADVKVVRDDTQTVIAVKSATIDTTDATKVAIETYTDMADGKEYTVTYTAQDEAKTESSKKFTATDGKIASFALSTDKVTVNKATTIKYSAIDANGVVIYTKEITDKPTGIEIENTCDSGYLDGSKLTLMTVGATAKFVVSYHTYKYEGGVETGVVKGEFVVTAAENDATVSKFNYTIVTGTDIPAWENVTVNTKLAMNDTNKKARFQIKDSNNEDITKTCGYTVESSNSNVLLASGDVKDGAVLTPIAEGSAYLVLKDDTKTVTTLAITVVGKRVITDFALDKSAVAVATTAAVAKPGSASIGFTLKDQYGDKMTGVTVSDPVCKSKPSGASDLTVSTAGNQINVAVPTDSKKGTYVYNVVATDKENKTQTRSFSVNVVAPSGSTSYALQFVKGTAGTEFAGTAAIASLDSTITKDTDSADQMVAVNVVEKKSGVIIGGLAFSAATVSVSAIKVIGSDGKTYAASGAGITKPVTSAAIDDDAVNGAVGKSTGTDGNVLGVLAVDYDSTNFTKKLPAGTYNVVVTLRENNNGKAKSVDVSGSFKVEDKQPTLTASVLSTTVKNTDDIEDVFENKDYLKYVYDGVTQADEDGNITGITVDKVYGKANKNTCVVNKVTVKVAVPGSSNTVSITVPVNRAFTTDQTEWDANKFTTP